MTTHTLRATAAGRAPSLEQGWHYVRRCVEMVAAMVAGMLTLAPVERPVWPELTVRADVGVLMLARSMSIGPAAWMWVRVTGGETSLRHPS
jgi:hypothetical protein